MRAHCHGGCRARTHGCSGAALHAGVHVGLVVIADVEHIVVALEHAGEAAKANVGGAAIAALCNHAHIVRGAILLRLDLECCGNARSHRRCIAEQRMDPGQLPGGFRIGRAEHFQATGGIGCNELVVGGSHGRIHHVACAQGLAAALTGAVSGVE